MVNCAHLEKEPCNNLPSGCENIYIGSNSIGKGSKGSMSIIFRQTMGRKCVVIVVVVVVV